MTTRPHPTLKTLYGLQEPLSRLNVAAVGDKIALGAPDQLLRLGLDTDAPVLDNSVYHGARKRIGRDT
jgi:hypothetical protein